MKSVHHCKACGFISTIRSEFKLLKKFLFCKQCLDEYEKKSDPDVVRWINDALLDMKK